MGFTLCLLSRVLLTVSPLGLVQPPPSTDTLLFPMGNDQHTNTDDSSPPLLPIASSARPQPKKAESGHFDTTSFRERIFQPASAGQRADAGRSSQRPGRQFDRPHLALGCSKSYFLSLAKVRRVHQKPGSCRALSPGSMPGYIVLDLQQVVPQVSGT